MAANIASKKMSRMHDRIENFDAKKKSNQLVTRRYSALLNQIQQAVGGVDFKFIQSAEFYTDLMTTVMKMDTHLQLTLKQKSFVRILLSKQRKRVLNTFQENIDTLCGRIFFCYAQHRAYRRR
jgi:hypothetical protein